MTRFNQAAATLAALVTTVACGSGSIIEPGKLLPIAPDSVATYRATLTASPACADKLPEAARERTYNATLYSNGNIKWEAATLNHGVVTQGGPVESTFTFSLGDSDHVYEADSESIREPLDSGGTVIIWGSGHGTAQDSLITGTLDGGFAFVTGAGSESGYCEAPNHHFTFIRQ